MTATASNIGAQRNRVTLARSGRIVEDDMTAITELLWNHGPATAYNFYRKLVNGPTEIAVSHRVESLAFPGTAWAELFDLMCGYATYSTDHAPAGWTHVEGGAIYA